MRDEGFPGTLEARFSALAARSLVRENPLWMPLLGGRPVDPRHEVAWLRRESLGRIRVAPDRVRLVEGSIVDAVAALPPGAVDAVGLSNVPDWLDPADRERLWAGLGEVLPPGGRVLVRSALRAAPLPTGAAAERLVLDEASTARLTAAERSGLYATVGLLRRVEAGDDRR
jgi:S-adenosylmethionine:diacylglycerol 3-amino-3-carboxypropyl transferase